MQGNGAEHESETSHCRAVDPLAGDSIDDNVISNHSGRRSGCQDGSANRRCWRARSVGVRIAVVGGGSTYTPELVEGLAVRGGRLPVDELVLLDPDPDRVEVVGGLARRMLQRLEWPGRLILTPDTDAALDGADFVVVQLRVGGQAARFVDETLPPRFGTIGQETTGAGGFAKALRTVPVVLDIAGAGGSPGGTRPLDRRLHEPRRDRQPGAPRRRPPGDRAVQRGDRVPAPVRRAVRRDAGSRRARACRAQSPDLGAGDPRRRRRPAAGAARRGRRGARRGPADAARADPVAARRSRPTTCATTTCSTRSSPTSAATATRRAPRRSSRSSGSCSRCTAIRR